MTDNQTPYLVFAYYGKRKGYERVSNLIKEYGNVSNDETIKYLKKCLEHDASYELKSGIDKEKGLALFIREKE